jgi:hypothetical protein
MQRPWVVRPAPGEIEVEDDAIVASLLEASAILKRCGGVLTVIVQREEGDFPGEMFTTAAVFQWKDRTDAKSQPETRQQILPAPLPADPEPDMLEEHLAREERLGEALTDNPDGFPMETLEEEDVDSIPQGAR